MDARATCETALDVLLERSPEFATSVGDHRHDDRLDDLTPRGVAATAEALTQARDALDTLDLDAADLDTTVDVETLRAALDRRLFDDEVLAVHTWNPLVHLPGEALWPLLARDVLPVGERLQALAARLAAVPERLAAAERTLGELPEVHRDTAVQQARGVLGLVRDQVGALLQQEPSLRSLVAPAQQAAAAALERYVTWLQRQEATRDPRLGAELFAARLHLVLDAETSAAGVVQAAHRRLEEVEQELQRVARDWMGDVPDPVAAALARCAADTPGDAGIVELARTCLRETEQALRGLGRVTVPDAPVEVQVMPEFRRGVAVAYCDAPGALESGGTTYYAISPTPGDWDRSRVAGFYREYNTAMLTNLTVHEAMPGHVLQLAHARQHPSRVRAVLRSGSFVEGWAVHAEALMADAGHGGPAVRVQQLKMALRMALNAVLDAGVHRDGMLEHEALALLTGRGHQEEGEAVGKWRRAQLTSAQLSTYFVGWLELAPLLAGRDALDPVLAHGSPAPRHLRTLLGA